MNIQILPSAKARDAQANLDAFVARGKASDAFGAVEWEADCWSNLIIKASRGREGWRESRKFYFLTGYGAERGAVRGEQMEKPFVDFVKAALRVQEDADRKMWSRHCSTIAACRQLHDALAEVDYDPCRALPRHFDLALRKLMEGKTPAGAHQAGLNLQRVAGWIDQYGIGRVRLGWKSNIRTTHNHNRISDEAAAFRDKKMPSQAALEALPIIANLVTDDADVIQMRAVELLVCGGWRINELLEIPEDCEVIEGSRYGIRYFGAKGFGDAVKWIPTPMIDVAKRAVADIRRLTQPARDTATFIHQNPGRHPLFQGMDEDIELTTEQARAILGFTDISGVRHWIRQHNVPIRNERPGNRRTDVFIKARDIELAYLMLSEKEPPGPLPLRKSLFVIYRNALHASALTRPGLMERVTAKRIMDFLSRNDEPTAGSIFKRLGFNEADGTPIKVTTHQFRHWLNTMAQEGGMTQELIARWSGRKDMKQNAAYDHVSGTKLAEKVRALAEAGEVVGQIVRVRDALPPVERNAFLKTQIATGHVTEIGTCVHDWSLVPCAVHGDCPTCVEHLVEKGNVRQAAEARRQLEEVSGMLAEAEREDADGTYGAARWVVSHRRSRDGLLAVVAIHEDPTVPDGTMVHLGR